MPTRITCVAVLFAATISISAHAQPAGDKPKAAPEHKPPFTISKETTYLTGPLDEDGYVDYLAALNEMESRGVTPENNAAVLLWQAFGPSAIDEELRPEFFKLLGIDPLPEEGEYFVELDEFVRRRSETDGEYDAELERAYEQLDIASGQPWADAEFPLLTEWLRINEKPLQLIEQATQRPRCYQPVVSSFEPAILCAETLPSVQKHRASSYALLCRSTRMNSEGELANFQDDLLTVHRLARHTSEGPFLIDYLVGLMLEGMAQGSVAHLAQTGKLPARSAREIERRIKALPDFPSAFEGLGDAERFCYLDAVAYVSRTGAYGLADLEELTFSSDLGALHQRLCYVAVPFIDWDVPLRIGNEFFDVLATASDASTPSERDETFARLERWEETQTANDSASIMWTMLLSESPREDLSKAVSTVFVELLLAGYQTVPRLDDRHSVQTSLVQVHLALAAYHADHDEYPNRLDALAPTYIAKLPDDLFTGEPLKYRVKGDTYTLYSVGHDRVDDGGTLPDDIVLGAPLE